MSEYSCYIISVGLIVLIKIVCFIIGYLTVRLGYNLITSGIKGEFKFSANMGGFKADLVSVSPGLLFVVLGILLIGYAIHVDKEAELEINPPAITKPNPPVPLPNDIKIK